MRKLGEETREEGAVEEREVWRIIGIGRERLEKRRNRTAQNTGIKRNFKGVVQRLDGRRGVLEDLAIALGKDENPSKQKVRLLTASFKSPERVGIRVRPRSALRRAFFPLTSSDSSAAWPTGTARALMSTCPHRRLISSSDLPPRVTTTEWYLFQAAA